MLCFLLFFLLLLPFLDVFFFSYFFCVSLNSISRLMKWNDKLFILSQLVHLDWWNFCRAWYSDFMSQTLSEMMINWMKVESSSCPSFCSQINEMRNHLLEDKEVDLCIWKSLSKLVVNLDWDFFASGWNGTLEALECFCETNFFILV